MVAIVAAAFGPMVRVDADRVLDARVAHEARLLASARDAHHGQRAIFVASATRFHASVSRWIALHSCWAIRTIRVVRYVFHANWPVVLNVADLDEVAGVVDGARVQALLIYARQLGKTVVVGSALGICAALDFRGAGGAWWTPAHEYRAITDTFSPLAASVRATVA